MQPKRILIIQLRQLGDILLTTPCLRAIKEDDPGHHIVFLSHPMGQLVLDGNEYIDEHWQYSETIKGSIELIQRLRAGRFDLVFDFMNNPRSALFAFACRGAHKYSFESSSRSWVYDKTIVRPKNSDYIVREKFQLLASAGIRANNEALILGTRATDFGSWNEYLKHHPAASKAPLRVVLSPTHRRTERQWPGERYAQLADRLTKEWNAAVFWLWGPGEEGFVDAIQSQCREKTYKTPPTKFGEMSAFIAKSDLFIGNSNGPSHVAVALDTCSIQLHGPTEMRAWCPLTAKHRAIQKGRTMSVISVDDVWAAASSFKGLVEAEAAKKCV